MINNSGILVADVSSYQVDPYYPAASINTLAKKLYNVGVRGLMIKLTEGTGYENSYAAMQYRAWATVMHNHGHEDPKVGFYDYCDGYNGAANANYFASWLKAFGMTKDTAVALDFEDPSVGGDGEVNAWLKVMKDHGYKNRVVYSMASWFGSKLNTVAIQCNNFWVAAYGNEAPSLVGSKWYRTAWQFSDNYRGLHVDMSLDYGHILAPDAPKAKKGEKKPAKKVAPKKVAKKPAKSVKKVTRVAVAQPSSPQYAKFSGIYQNDIAMNMYSDVSLTKRIGTLPAKSMVKAYPVADGKATRLLLRPFGVFVSGNLKWVHLLHKE